MPAKHSCHPSQGPLRTEGKRVVTLSARERAAATPAEAEPIRRWPRPAGETPTTETPPAVREPAPAPAPQLPLDIQTQMLEQLELQSQLLVDLLGAVNGLTAAVLAQANRA